MEIRKTLRQRIQMLLDDNGIFWRWWYGWTLPPATQFEASFAGRDLFRRARLASAMLLSMLLLALLALPIFLNNPSIFPLFPALLISFSIGIILNRKQKTTLVGILLIAVLEAGLISGIISSPNGLSVYNLPLFDSLVVTELVAVSLLTPTSVFGMALINSIFIWAAITFLPHSPEVGEIFATMRYALFTRPIFLHVSIAITSYLWVRNSTQAMLRADRAEEIAQLQKTIAEQNQQRIEALQTEREITLAYEQQRKINTLKDQFLAHVSHELRTPLTALGGFLELIEMFDAELDVATRINFLHKSMESFYELSNMVNSVMDVMTLIAEVSPESTIVPLARTIREVLDQFEPQEEIQTHSIYLNIAEHIKVWADQSYLQQILYHLISNALKYSPEQTVISIEVQPAASPYLVCVCVQDEGPGIPPEEASLLFEKFVRLERDQGKATRGLGLGLYITKTLVEAMQGQVWIENSGQQGSRFCFTLPSSSGRLYRNF